MQNRNSNGNFLSCADFTCWLPSVCFISTEGGGYMPIFRATRFVLLLHVMWSKGGLSSGRGRGGEALSPACPLLAVLMTGTFNCQSPCKQLDYSFN